MIDHLERIFGSCNKLTNLTKYPIFSKLFNQNMLQVFVAVNGVDLILLKKDMIFISSKIYFRQRSQLTIQFKETNKIKKKYEMKAGSNFFKLDYFK